MFPITRLTNSGKSDQIQNTGIGVDGVYVTLEQLLDQRHVIVAKRRASGRVLKGLPGEVVSMVKGPGIEFEDIRPYLPGDDLRHMDWRVTARTGLPFTRRYSEDREHSALVVVDQRVNMFFGSGRCFKSYAAAIGAAEHAWSAVDNGYRLGGVIVSDTIDVVPAGYRKRSVLEIINKLHLHNNAMNINSQSQVGLEDVLEQVSSRLQPGMQVTIFSDFSDLTDNVVSIFRAIVKHCSLTLVQVYDPVEEKLTKTGAVGVSNGVKIARVVLNRKSRSLYMERRTEIKRQLVDAANLTGVAVVQLNANSIV